MSTPLVQPIKHEINIQNLNFESRMEYNSITLDTHKALDRTHYETYGLGPTGEEESTGEEE